MPAGADGVLALPVLGDGERTDPDLRAAFAGLSLRHDRAVLARAMMEGVAFAIRDQLGLLTQGGARVTELRVSGGDTRLASWNRIKADVLGLPVVTVPGDAAVGGVAMLAGLGAGTYATVDEAIATLRPSRASPGAGRPDPHPLRRALRGLARAGRGGRRPPGGLTACGLQLGINTCFAVKRWPLPEDWAPIVRDELGLRLVQHSLDLVDLHADEEGLQSQADALQSATAAHDLELHSTFTGLAAYSSNLLLSPDAAEREAADAWLRAAIGFTAISGAQATGGHVGCFSVADWHDRPAGQSSGPASRQR